MLGYSFVPIIAGYIRGRIVSSRTFFCTHSDDAFISHFGEVDRCNIIRIVRLYLHIGRSTGSRSNFSMVKKYKKRTNGRKIYRYAREDFFLRFVTKSSNFINDLAPTFCIVMLSFRLLEEERNVGRFIDQI